MVLWRELIATRKASKGIGPNHALCHSRSKAADTYNRANRVPVGKDQNSDI